MITGIQAVRASVALGLAAVLGGCSYQPVGYTETGTKFGVSVGDNIDAVKQSLSRRGLADDGAMQGGSCHDKTYPPSITIHRFYDESWRRGIICVGEVRGKVVSLQWYYNMFTP